jgi:hypothetical protein
LEAGLNMSLSVQLHNALIVSIFDMSLKKVTPKPAADAPRKPPRKRRRLLPYQGPDELDAVSLRSDRLKKWTVGLGKHERERVRALETGIGPPLEWPQPTKDEIAREQGVVLLRERGGVWSRPLRHTFRASKLCQNRRAAVSQCTLVL